MFTIAQIKEHLTGMGHGGSLNKVRNTEALFERAAGKMMLLCKPVETIRVQGLTQTVHDQLQNYSLPSDFLSAIDLYPQANRGSFDQGTRVGAEQLARRLDLDDKVFSIEGDAGSKVLRIDWAGRPAKTLNSMDDYDGNGTWSAVGSASGIQNDTIYKYAGSASVSFDLTATGDGIQNTGMSAVDLTDEDEVADVIVPIYFGSVSGLTSVTGVWGNDLTTKYWTGVAQTAQSDGTAFRVGWNLIRIPWSTATETGTVTPSTIDSFKLTIAKSSALTNIRVDNILFVIGYPFDLKYYSKYWFKNSSGTYLSRPTSDDDNATLDNDSLPLYLNFCLIEMAQQMEGADSSFDIGFARRELFGDPASPSIEGRMGQIRCYNSEHPAQNKKLVGSYGGLPRLNR